MADIKTYKKSSAFWKHGKHLSMLPEIKRQERTKTKKPKEPMYDSVQKAFRSARKKH